MEAEGRRYRSLQINVGGTIFHTTEHTLAKADDKSLLYGLIDTVTTPEDDEAEKKRTIFFDRDPSLFEALLYVLRTGQRPAAPPSPSSSSSSTTHHQTLTPWFRCLQTEASFYGVTKALKSAFSPSEFNGMDLTCQHLPLFEGEKSATTAISAVADGDFAVSLGNRLSWYDWTLNKIRTLVTPLEHGINVLAHVNNSVVVAARSKWRNTYEERQWDNLNFPREWNTDLSLPRSGSPIYVFDANHKFQRGCIKYKEYGCESVVCGDGGRIILALMQNDTEDRNKKAVLEVDAETLQVSRVVAEHEGDDLQINHYGRLQWIEGHSLLLAHYTADGPSGSCEESSIRLFDVRAPEAEIFSQIEHFRHDDVVWSEGHGKFFKINYFSFGDDDDGNAMYAGDLRNGFITWERCRTREATSTMAAGYFDGGIIAHGKQVFASNQKSLVVWDEVDDSGLSFRQSRFHWGDTDIAGMAFGGEKLYVVRHGANFIEVLKSAPQDVI